MKMRKKERQKAFEGIDLRGKTLVFTGGSDGMGKAAVTKLAKMGATIMLLGRNESKTKAVVSELNTIANKENTYYVHCDLASQKSIRKAAKIVLEKCPKIDYLINCAGMNAGERNLTKDGYEMNWAVNHLGPFLFNNLLLDRMKESSNSRIVNLSSATESWTKIHFADIQYTKNWRAGRTYAQAKLALNMCTRRLAKELENTSVTVNALNPGFIKSNILNQGLKGWRKIAGAVYMYISASETEVGGDRILRLALSKEFEGISGKFIYEDAIKDPNPEALNDEIVERVWNISKKHVGI